MEQEKRKKRYIQRVVRILPEQRDFLEEYSISFSKFVRKALDKEMKKYAQYLEGKEE